MGTQNIIRLKLALALAVVIGVSGAITAQAACTVDLTPASRNHGFGASTALVSVAASSSCAWTVVNNNSWITILSGASGSGNGTVTYAIEGNPNPGTRSGALTIGGEQFTVTQTGVNCTYSISPPDHNKCPNYTTGTVQITTQSPCPWTIDNTNDWILITSALSGTGSSKVFFTVLSNATTMSRTGVVMIAGLPFTIRQTSVGGITCPADKQVECGTAWNFDQPVVTGGSVTVQVVSTVTNFVCGNSFIAVRTWASTDACGTGMECSQSVAVIDLTPPSVICAPDKSVGCGQPWDFDAPSGTDACDDAPAIISIVGTVTNIGGANSFTAVRTWRLADRCGNAATCSQTVTFTNTSSFIFTCAADKQVECGTAWNFDPPTVTNGSATVQIVSTVTNPICGNSFIAVRTWAATDACGTRMECSQSVAVLDLTPPTIQCAPDKSIACGQPWNFDPPTGTDLCDGTAAIITIVSTVTNATGMNSFTAIRTWRLADGCSNAVTCSQTVTFTNNAFTVTCPPDRMVPCDGLWDFDTPVVNGGCGAIITTISTTTNAGACGNNYIATRVWQISDGVTISNCTQIVSVVDQTPPTVPVCPPDITVSSTNDAPHCPKTLTEFIFSVGTNNPPPADNCGPVRYVCTEDPIQGGPCGGVITRYHIFYDLCMNTNICIQRIFVLGSNTVVNIAATPAVGTNPCAGGTITFCASVSGIGPFSYAWLFDGAPIAGETASCLTITNLDPASVTRYSVQVVGMCETVTRPLSLPDCGGQFAPAIGGIQFVPAGVYLKIIGQPNSTYLIYCGNDIGKQWNVIGAATTAANGIAEFIDKVSGDDKSRMYRLRAVENEPAP